MNDIEDRLRADGAAWQHLVDAGRHATMGRTPRLEHRRWLAPALVAAVIVAVAGAVALIPLGGSDRHVPSAVSRWRTHTFGGLTLHYPAAWHAVVPTFTAFGGTPLGYLVNRDPLPQCRPNGDCGAPIYELTGNAALVSASRFLRSSNLHTTTTIDGWPASIAREQRCWRSGTYGISATLLVGNSQVIDVSACTASTDPADRRVLDRIVRSLRYSDPTRVHINGRLLEEGGPPGTPPRGLPGTVTLRPVDGGRAVLVQTGGYGWYSADVSPGRYTITGRSPRIQSGRAVCPAPGNPIVARHAVRVDVVCAIN